MVSRWINVILFSWAIAGAALAHDLRVFAFVTDENQVNVEAKFSSGRVPRSAKVVVTNADQKEIFQLPMNNGFAYI